MIEQQITDCFFHDPHGAQNEEFGKDYVKLYAYILYKAIICQRYDNMYIYA